LRRSGGWDTDCQGPSNGEYMKSRILAKLLVL